MRPQRPRTPVGVVTLGGPSPVAAIVCDDGSLWRLDYTTDAQAPVWLQAAPPVPGSVASGIRAPSASPVPVIALAPSAAALALTQLVARVVEIEPSMIARVLDDPAVAADLLQRGVRAAGGSGPASQLVRDARAALEAHHGMPL